ncbi:ketosteroid isomerase-like protein [Paenibacillus rhizosphaerae]|uniref:Ketosteroid isomerase-like protein n=1 Tax=Paenibacillus rhizosphaerae TaxID=297318 RepID=A0A839TUP8_9BACL|nr:DUF4440 domain-containing protein [Paenibacillus rhizosphaerae]MBB3130566.1 ketosteroid isomerase-like protein [Paenibacillus rhizosphaerae]
MKLPANIRPVMRPEDMNEAFAEAFNSGDIHALLSLYEPNSILMNPAGRLDQGIERIRGTLDDLLQLQGRMKSRNIYCIPFENIALLRAHFILHTQDGNGNPVQVEGHTSEVIRRQTDGSWRYIIDHPSGSDLLERIRQG